jgi:hypothetical protein
MRASPCVFRRRSAAGSKPEKTTSGCFRAARGSSDFPALKRQRPALSIATWLMASVRVLR